MLAAGCLMLWAGRNAALGSPVIMTEDQGASVPVNACVGGLEVLLVLLLLGGLPGFALCGLASAFGCCSVAAGLDGSLAG